LPWATEPGFFLRWILSRYRVKGLAPMCNDVTSVILGSGTDSVLPYYYNLTFFTTLLTAVLHEGEETLALFVLRS